MPAPKRNGGPLDAYIRVSRVGERGGDPAYGSPDIQREAIEWWAKGRGVKIARTFIEEDETAGEREAPRPKLEEAIRRAINGTTDGIAFYNLSRFSRFTEQGLADARRLREAGARLVFVSEGMGGEEETIDTRGGNGKLIFTILLAMQEAALDTLKAGWRKSKARAIREGRQIGPTPPGYRRATERNGHPKGSLVPDGERAEAIAAAYREVARTGDLRAAIPILEAAIPEKTFVVRKQKMAERYGVKVGESATVQATWNTTTVRRLLKSPVYIGAAFYDDGEIETNWSAHPALIDGSTWRRVQRVIGIPDELRRQPKGDYPLSGGLLVCATCGGAMIGGRMGAGRRGYHCNRNKLRTPETCEHPARVLAEPLEAQVRALLVQHAQAREEELEWDDEWPPTGSTPLGPEDTGAPATEARQKLRDAEAERDNTERKLRELGLPDASVTGALEPYDRAVEQARAELEDAEADAAEAGEPPEPTEIAYSTAEQLPEFLERFGLVVRVEPAFGDRRPGRVGERVRLVPREDRL